MIKYVTSIIILKCLIVDLLIQADNVLDSECVSAIWLWSAL